MSDAEILKRKIDSLDLEIIKSKFLTRKSWWWCLWNNVDDIEKEYRRFLLLVGTSAHSVVPWNEELDNFWHEHILDTKKYETDCMELFGKMVHHNPHLTKGTEEHKSAVKSTRSSYKENFSSNRTSDYNDYSPPMIYDAGCGSANHSNDHHSDSSCGGHHSGDPSCSSSSCGSSSCSSSSCGSGCGGGGD